ncbi:glycosyltransferase family 4 protein [Dysgonomonas sp. OttesenSCG-928-D17]|nr:glycosyltransferase family 4 protein [Dysgonomonas sp. OttesenSCG-928-D17]
MNIVIDCERMKYPNTGLYTFGDKFSHAINSVISPEDNISFYIDRRTGKFMGEDARYIEKRLIDKLLSVPVKSLDIWHTTYQLSKYIGGSKNTKNVLTVHDLNFLYEKTSPSDIVRYTKKHQKRIDRADYIVAISEFAKKDILEHLDVKGKPVIAIHNGCILPEYDDFDAPLYRPQRPYILAIGTVVPKKNFHVLPAILKNNDYELIIAGIKSDYVAKIEDEARRHNVEDRVKIIGAISDAEKYWYLKNCLAFAFPSLAEGFGMPVLEAMRFGKPVFISNLTSLPEIGGKYAYYFENFDPEYMQGIFEKGMEDYIADKDKAELIKQHAFSFNWENCARKYYQVYQSLL